MQELDCLGITGKNRLTTTSFSDTRGEVRLDAYRLENILENLEIGLITPLALYSIF